MMRLAFTRNPAEPAPAGGLLLRMRAWFAGEGVAPCSQSLAAARKVPALRVISRKADADDYASVGQTKSEVAPKAASKVPSLAPAGQNSESSLWSTLEKTSGVVLAFPLYGEALLAKLADHLRGKIEGSALAASFDLRVIRQPHSCLVIDNAASIEFHPQRSLYCLAIEIAEGTSIKVESNDFDTIVRFVAQYVGDRLSADMASDSASEVRS